MEAAIVIVWDVLKTGAHIKRVFGYVMSSKNYVRDLQKEVENLRDRAERVENYVLARNNLTMVSSEVIEWLASAETALREAEGLLGDFEKATKTCRRGTLRDLSCRYQFSRNAKYKMELIQGLAVECSTFENIPFDVGAPTSTPRVERGLHTVSDLLRWAGTAIKYVMSSVSDLLRWAGTAIKYVMSSEIYAQDLQKEVGKLACELDWVHLAMEEAEKDHRNVYSLVRVRRKRADEALKEARHLLDGFKEASKTRSRGTLPDPSRHYEFSTKARDKIKRIQKLTQEIREYEKLNDICFSGGFESRDSVILKIMDALAGNSNSVVGVYGMGGVGKSTLLVDAEKRLRGRNLFNLVAKADVSENPDIKKIQKEIARCLGLSDLDKEEDVRLRAERLRGRLEKEESEKRKVLIILDDLWDKLDLKSVGIPCGHDNKAIGCKLLLTSRYGNVLRKEMRCDSAFPLGVLKEEEAKRLFETMVGGKVPVDLEPLVEEALRICAGLPFLIVAIAKLFINTSYDACKDALKHIWNEETGKVTTNMLQRSYDRISQEEKLLLRLCVACGVSETPLEYLARYGFGLGIFGEVNSVQEARDKLRRLIHNLQAASLLLDGDEDADGFRIHGLVREFVASFASTDRPLLVLKDKDKSVTEFSKDKLKRCEAICFPFVDLEGLPEELVCPELRIFLLFENNESLKILDSYFNSMKNLMALDLTGIHLTHSPSPFQSLEKLHSLCLDYCSLEDVATLGKLKGLQILSLRNSDIHRLPKEIGQLIELRLLDLSRCSQLEIIEPGVLGSLNKLEELYMDDSFHQWSAVEQTAPTNASLIELNHMKELRTLNVFIPRSDMLPEDLNFQQLTKYRIGIGRKWHWWSECKGTRTLYLELKTLINVPWKGCIQSILGKTDNLHLDKLDGSEQSICTLSQKGFPQLKRLKVENSPSIRCILQLPSHAVFETLESLLLKNLVNLEKICYSYISNCKSFSTLKVVRVQSCNKMEVLFPHSVARELPQLEEIKVVGCKLMRGIVEADDDCGKFELPKLRVLELSDLPNIENFIITGLTPSSSTSDGQVGTQIAFFSEQQVAFLRLETLEIDRLDNLRFMFSPSMVRSLTQLRKISISECKKMEAIIMEEEGSGVEISETLQFPMLTDLSLARLESLMCFSCEKCSQEDRSQDHVQLHSSTLFNREAAFPSLEKLYIEDLDNIEMIWDDQVAVDSFSKLNSLYVDKCNKLVNVVPSIVLGQLLSLERLEAKSCGLLKVVFKFQPLNPLDGHSVARSPLRKLKLFDLPKLKCIWDKEGLEEQSFDVEAIEGTSHEVKVILPFTSYFQRLTTLSVSCCDELSNMFTPTMATNLMGLTKLKIRKCGLLTEVISNEGGREGHVVAFNQLKYIELDGLIGLRCFYSGGYTLKMPLLEEVIVTGCLEMKFFSGGPIEASKLERVQASKEAWFWKENLNITVQHMFEEMGTAAGIKNVLLSEFPELIGKWHSELNPIKSSWQLQSLTVDKCTSFINAIPSRLMLVLENMETLQVRDCESLEEIFDLEGLENVESTQVLPSFGTLDLVNLPKLRRLWNKDLQGSLSYDCLNSVTLYKCSSLTHAFVPSMARCLANLKRIEIKECGQMEGVIAEEEGQGSVVEKILFQKLERWNLECLPNLTSFLLGKNHTLECPELKELTIAHCPKMRTLAWQSLMEIHNGAASLFTPQVQFPRLQQMVLSHMDNLSKIWTDNPQETLSFGYLWKVEVHNCKSLVNLFPYWVATSQIQPKELRVESCGIEEIVASGNDTPHSTTAQVLFPELRSLVLHDMPRLKTFCPNLPTLNWPFLKELRVTHCDQLNIPSFAASMNKWAQKNDQQDLSDQEAHSSFERDFPNLKKLLLVENDIQIIEDGKFPDDIFGQIEAITLACFHEENAVFPTKFLLERFQNLKSFEIFCSSFEDIFLDEGIVDEGKHPVIESLRELKLSKLHKLKRVWREDYLVSKILQSIEALEVWDCPGLTMLFPAVTSFENLMVLVVKNSSGLVHLATASAIASLVNLNKVTIIGCERMKEVVANDENGEGKVISFRKLEWLTLQDMPSLECFTSCILRFPSLRWIEMEECPKMKIFSKGTLSIPELYHGKLFRYKWNEEWKGDLNRAILELST